MNKLIRQQHPQIQSYVFGALLVLLFLLVCRLFAPFFTVLLWATLLYIMITPLHHRVIKNLNFATFRGRVLKNIWAAVFALGTMTLILIPLLFVGSVFVKQIMDMVRYTRDYFSKKPEILHTIFERISTLVRDLTSGQVIITPDDIQAQLMNAITAGLQQIVYLGSSIARNIGGFSINMFLLMFSLFFFFADGPYLSRLVLGTIPIKKEYIRTLTAKFMDITRNLFIGYIIIALLQSIMAYIVFSIFHVQGSLVFAVITFICVFIPMIGGGVVWMPLGILKILNGHIVEGILFLAVSAAFISTWDNFVRPLFLKDRIQLHPLIIFFAIMGGIIVFGFNGLILGPMVVIIFLTVLDLFFIEHRIGGQDQ